MIDDLLKGSSTKLDFRRRRKLYFSVFIVNLVNICTGASITWTSPSIPYLKSPNPILVINEAETSLITTLTMTGQIFGPLLSGLLTAHIGRKWSIFVIIVMYVVHWLLLGLALNVYCLYIARFIAGAAIGINLSALPMYVAEIAEDDVRSVLNSFPFASRSIGLMVCYSIGPFVSYRLLIYICTVLPVILLVLVLFLPESPYYLIDKGQKDKAIKELCWIRDRSPEGVTEEINVIQARRDQIKIEQISWTQFFKTPENVKALIFSIMIRFTQEFTGISVILYLMETIFITAQVPIPSSICPIIIGGVMFVAGCFSPVIINNYGYKKPYIVSLIGVGTSLAVLAFHYFLVEHGHHYSWLTYVPLICLTFYSIFYCIGVVNTSFAIVGEIFAPNVRSLGTSAANSIGFFMGDLTNIYYYALVNVTGTWLVMLTYAVLIFIGTVFIYIYIPETSQMSLEEIQQYLSKSSSKKNKDNKYYMNTINESVKES